MANYLIGGGFVDSAGNILAFGRLELVLSAPCTDTATGLIGICNQYTVTILLDEDGNCATTPAVQTIWPNNHITPAGTYYMATIYAKSGQIAWGPNAQSITATINVDPINIDLWMPSNPS